MEASDQLHAPAALSLGNIPRTDWIGGWVDPRAGLDVVARRKIPLHAGNRTPVVQLVATYTSLISSFYLHCSFGGVHFPLVPFRYFVFLSSFPYAYITWSVCVREMRLVSGRTVSFDTAEQYKTLYFLSHLTTHLHLVFTRARHLFWSFSSCFFTIHCNTIFPATLHLPSGLFPSVYVLPLLWETKFHTHTKQQVKL
jgi:hypothetical protein